MDVLIVAALPEETVALPPGVPLLHLGVGKVQAAATLAAHLVTRGELPELVVNIGTAGGLRGQAHTEVVEVGHVFQHDLDVDGVSAFVGRPLAGGPLTLAAPPGVDAVLATGDRIVLDTADRDALGRDAAVVDMEGYAVAAVCHALGIPVRIVKAVSDGADAEAAHDWHTTLERCSRALLAWLEAERLLP